MPITEVLIMLNFKKGALSAGSCDRLTKRGREELPHIRGQGQKPGDPYPKGGSQEELPHVRGQGQRPRVPGCDGAGTAERSYPSLRSGVAARRSNPMMSKERWLRGRRRA